MTYREFLDDQGQQWEVWEIRPISIERRLNEERRRYPRLSDRRTSSVQLKIRGLHRDGWLTFQCGTRRRRLVPIPEHWDSSSDAELIALLKRATPLGRGELPAPAVVGGDSIDPSLLDASHQSLDEVPSDGGPGIQ